MPAKKAERLVAEPQPFARKEGVISRGVPKQIILFKIKAAHLMELLQKKYLKSEMQVISKRGLALIVCGL